MRRFDSTLPFESRVCSGGEDSADEIGSLNGQTGLASAEHDLDVVAKEAEVVTLRFDHVAQCGNGLFDIFHFGREAEFVFEKAAC